MSVGSMELNRYEVPQTSLLRKRMVQGGLVRANSTDRHHLHSDFRLLIPSDYRPSSENGAQMVVYRKKKLFFPGQNHFSECNLDTAQGRNSEDSSISWTQKKKGLKDSEEWKKKKSRILSKMRALGKINLALIIARMPTIEKLPDKVLQQIFSYLSPYQTLAAGRVCRRWRELTYGPALWQFVSFRANHGGIQVTNLDYFINLIGTRFTELKVTELATDLITPNVLHELAGRCPRLEHLTLDFSTAMQLHDFTDLQCFPSRLRGLTLCLGENIFLEGFLRKVYTFISSVEILHIIGTYEKVEDEEEEVFETVNVNKLKQYLPNLRVVNLWGVPFITDENVDQLSSNCAHLECLCVNYSTKVTGSSLQLVLQRCKKLRSLFLAYTSLNNELIQMIDWSKTKIEELDIRGTDLSSEALIHLLTSLPHLVWLDASWQEHFNDQVLDTWMQSGAMSNIQYLNLDTCDSLSEATLTELVSRHGHQLHGLNLGGHHKLLEYFWMNMIPKLRNIK
ncbi:hypothetical protein L596_003363 [Steinernema carpocapsae]|uniref:F-box domain-containing protein n=1 Tax=Steinernema carpocapsae TaxID=34508 RepID=A0A4V6I7Y4_STECR|nr:hypothetical protein L596_003363 [Steinernema carpocapsae]